MLSTSAGLSLYDHFEEVMKKTVSVRECETFRHGDQRNELIILSVENREMSLNIKDPEAHRLAWEIAEAPGGSITHAVIESLRKRLEQIRTSRRDPEILAANIRAVAKRAASQMKRPYIDHGEFLYDERGLPK